MASSTSITDLQGLADWLESLGYFSVALEDNTISMTDGNNNLISVIQPSGSQGIAIIAYTSDGLSATLATATLTGRKFIGVKCSGGAVLFTNTVSDMPTNVSHLAIVKNQNDETIFAWHNAVTGNSPYYYDTGYRSVSWNDSSIATYQTDMRIMNQTLLVPICSRPKAGQSSYSETAFLMYCAQSNTMIGPFILNGSLYYSTGWFAIKDD